MGALKITESNLGQLGFSMKVEAGRAEGDIMRVSKVLWLEIAQRLIDAENSAGSSPEEQPNGILNKFMYSNHVFMPEDVELFEKIEKALGFKLFRWQKTFIVMGVFRQYGETTAKILRDLLAVKEPPLDLSTPKREIERIHRQYYRDIQERLTAAGIPTRTVFYSNREKEHYGRSFSVCVIDELCDRQQP